MITLTNLSSTRYSGWKRLVTSSPLAGPRRFGNTLIVPGVRTGLSDQIIDVKVDCLEPGQSLEIGETTPVDFERGQIPPAPIDFFGGPARVDGLEMLWKSLVPNGAGWDCHLWMRTRRTLSVDLFFTWYPDQPGWASGRVMVTSSNPLVPDMVETLAEDLKLTFGDAFVVPVFAAAGRIVDAGTTFADGQSMVIPVTFLWLRHCTSEQEWGSAGAAAGFGIHGCAIEQLFPMGNPTLPPGFNGSGWAVPLVKESVRRLRTFEAPMLGANPLSPATGRQEDQLFVRGECFGAEGAGCGMLAELAAMKMANRPCHHLEVDGDPLRQGPDQIFWDMRPHWAINQAKKLGKPRQVSQEETRGWWGADVEHWLINTLFVGARMTGCPALQRLLEHQAGNYMRQQTIVPNWSTSQAYAARAIGYEGHNVVLLWRALRDRELAERVRQHWLLRWQRVILPHIDRMSGQFTSGAFLDCRENDPRLGTGWWWMPWQQAVGAYGLYMAGKEFDVPSARTWGATFALQVVNEAWVGAGEVQLDAPESAVDRSNFDAFVREELGALPEQTDATAAPLWTTRPLAPVSGGGIHDGSFNYFGMALAPAVVLMAFPAHPRARAIWNYLTERATTQADTSWLAPGVPQGS